MRFWYPGNRGTQSTWKRTCFHAMRQSGCKPGRISEATVWKTSRGELWPKSLRSTCPVTSRKRHRSGSRRNKTGRSSSSAQQERSRLERQSHRTLASVVSPVTAFLQAQSTLASETFVIARPHIDRRHANVPGSQFLPGYYPSFR